MDDMPDIISISLGGVGVGLSALSLLNSLATNRRWAEISLLVENALIANERSFRVLDNFVHRSGLSTSLIEHFTTIIMENRTNKERDLRRIALFVRNRDQVHRALMWFGSYAIPEDQVLIRHAVELLCIPQWWKDNFILARVILNKKLDT